MANRCVLSFLTAFFIVSVATSQPHRQHCVHQTGKLMSGEEQLHPGARRYILNIGSHADPPTPFDNETIVVAVEPNPETAAKIPVVPNRYVLTAAMSDGWGLAVFNHFDDSSSLLPGNFQQLGESFSVKGRQGAKILVPTLPLSALFKALQNIECWFVKVDTQGMDLNVVKSGHHLVRNCQYLMTETYCNGFTYYKGAQNDFDIDWLPHMTQMGFKPLNVCTCPQCETNIIWQNTQRDVLSLEVVKQSCPKCFT